MKRLSVICCSLMLIVGCVGLVACGSNSSGETSASAATPDAKTSRANEGPRNAKTSWPIFRGNSMATGVSKDQLPDELELVWKYEVDGGSFEATAAIVDGIAYIGDLDGTVFALNLKDGSEKWRTNFSEKSWTFEDGKPESKMDDTELSGFMSSPTVKDGRLYIGDIFGRFFCLDTETGKPVWGYEASAEIDGCANFYKGNILFGSQDATLYCLNAKSGKLIWKHEIEDQIRCSPTIVGDRTFVAGCDSRLHIIDLEKGESIAGVDIDAPTMVTPAVLGDNVFFGTEGGALFCVNWKLATTEWTFADDSSSQSIRSCPAVTESHVIFGGRSKRVYAVDPSDGKEMWTFTAKGGVDSSPVIVGNRVFVGSSDGRVYGLNLMDGSKAWEFEAGGGFIGSPAVADGKLVIASDRGVVYCFGEAK